MIEDINNKILFIRHGESLSNVKKESLQYIPDCRIPLTPKGRVQADLLGEFLSSVIEKDVNIQVLYSPFDRAKQTKEIVLEHFNTNSVIQDKEDYRIREVDIGNFISDFERIRKER